MSDEAAAPVEAAPTEAAPVEAKETKPVVEVDELEELLKKKPVPYKAGGKEHFVKDAKSLRQMLSRVSGVDAAAAAALKEKQEAQAFKAKRDSIKQLKGAARARAVAEFFEEDPSAMREAFADDILEAEDKRAAQEKMSERERQLYEENDRLKSESQKFREAQERYQQEQEHAELTERVKQVGARLEEVAVKAAQKAKIAGAALPRFLPAIAERLDRNERLGLDLSEDEVADVVMKEHGELADQFYGSLDIPALADRLEALEVDDPEKPGAKVSRARLLMREYAKRIKAKSGAQSFAVPQSNGAPKASPIGESAAEKMAFWRR